MNGTSPSVGSGKVKAMRDSAMVGYCVGATPGHPNKPPTLIGRRLDHVIAYDVEVEYFGDQQCSIDNPIWCAAVVCTCGRRVVINRVEVRIPGVIHVNVADNAEMTEAVMDEIVKSQSDIHCSEMNAELIISTLMYNPPRQQIKLVAVGKLALSFCSIVSKRLRAMSFSVTILSAIQLTSLATLVGGERMIGKIPKYSFAKGSVIAHFRTLVE